MGFDVSIRIAGEAGQGIQTIGTALCRVIQQTGMHLFANQDYMSRVRGGNNFFQIRVADPAPVALREFVDVLLAMDAESVPLHRKALAAGGRMLIDKSKNNVAGNDGPVIDVPLFSTAKEIGGDERYVSTVALGVLSGMLGLGLDRIDDTVKSLFTAKGQEMVDKNIACAREGHKIGSQHLLPVDGRKQTADLRPRYLLNGNEAIAAGALFAGCRFYSAYPMSPSTTIMETLAHFSAKYHFVVEQAEDEIAAVNMVIGASFAGARAMTGTSGGGFALMTEGLSLAAMTETPIVIVDAQRPAPATGFPTRTEQADLDLVLHAGHGEFARVVYAPGSIEEAFELTVRAFDVSDRFQIPAIILTDQLLADSVRAVESFDTGRLKRDRHVLTKEESKGITKYRRYELTESGISPRAVPSWINDVIYADSDEHTEEGHITEDGELRIRMVDKRFKKKMESLTKEVYPPVSGHIDNALTILIGFGSTYGVLREVSDSMALESVGFIHVPQIWPFPVDVFKTIIAKAPGANIITVENNASGQLARLIFRETGIQANSSVLKYDGRPFSVDEVQRRVKMPGRNHGQ
jgi:2-oxoglutarate ferredoxin oxidoreductase subunit alpha